MFAGTAKDANLTDASWYVDTLFADSLCFCRYRCAENLQAAIENRRMKLISIEVTIRIARNQQLTQNALVVQPQLSDALEKRSVLNRILAKLSIVVGSGDFLRASKLNFV